MSEEKYDSSGEFFEDSTDPGSDDNHPPTFTLEQIQQLNEGRQAEDSRHAQPNGSATASPNTLRGGVRLLT